MSNLSATAHKTKVPPRDICGFINILIVPRTMAAGAVEKKDRKWFDCEHHLWAETRASVACAPLYTVYSGGCAWCSAARSQERPAAISTGRQGSPSLLLNLLLAYRLTLRGLLLASPAVLLFLRQQGSLLTCTITAQRKERPSKTE